jgi:hypothetical protein
MLSWRLVGLGALDVRVEAQLLAGERRELHGQHRALYVREGAERVGRECI